MRSLGDDGEARGALDAVGVMADPPTHAPEDGLSSLATLELGVEHLVDTLHGYGNMCAQTVYRLAFVLALKAGVGPATFQAMKDKILDLPSDGGTLLEKVKLCRPAAKVFLSFWEERGHHLALNLSRAEAQACEFQALGVDPGQVAAKDTEVAAARPLGDTTPLEPRDDGGARTATPDAPGTQV